MKKKKISTIILVYIKHEILNFIHITNFSNILRYEKD